MTATPSQGTPQHQFGQGGCAALRLVGSAVDGHALDEPEAVRSFGFIQFGHQVRDCLARFVPLLYQVFDDVQDGW
jgi:hypothetical protein